MLHLTQIGSLFITTMSSVTENHRFVGVFVPLLNENFKNLLLDSLITRGIFENLFYL